MPYDKMNGDKKQCINLINNAIEQLTIELGHVLFIFQIHHSKISHLTKLINEIQFKVFDIIEESEKKEQGNEH